MSDNTAEQLIRNSLGKNGGFEGKSVTELEEENIRDPLTGAYNRRKFDSEIQNLVDKNKPYGLIMIDIDNFREFNSEFGHPGGNSVLKEVYRICSDNVNTASVGEEDIVARLGGEEFGIILKNLSNLEKVEEIAERLRTSIEKTPFKIGNKEAPLTISAGAGCKNMDESSDDLEKRVDRALYESKNSGRNRVTISKYGK